MALFLNAQNYSFKNALFTGTCQAHWDEFSQSTFSGRAVYHLTLAVFQAVPVLGQFISLVESAVAFFFLKQANPFLVDDQPALKERDVKAFKFGSWVKGDGFQANQVNSAEEFCDNIDMLYEALIIQGLWLDTVTLQIDPRRSVLQGFLNSLGIINRATKLLETIFGTKIFVVDCPIKQVLANIEKYVEKNNKIFNIPNLNSISECGDFFRQDPKILICLLKITEIEFKLFRTHDKARSQYNVRQRFESLFPLDFLRIEDSEDMKNFFKKYFDVISSEEFQKSSSDERMFYFTFNANLFDPAANERPIFKAKNIRFIDNP